MHNPPLLLLVDDVAENLVLLEAIFAPEGYATRSAGRGEDALRIARAEALGPRAAGRAHARSDGFAVCRRRRADAATALHPRHHGDGAQRTGDRIQG